MNVNNDYEGYYYVNRIVAINRLVYSIDILDKLNIIKTKKIYYNLIKVLMIMCEINNRLLG